jgi:flagellar hook-basal body complex protein FliE
MAAIRGVGSEILQQAYKQATAKPEPQGGGFSARLQELVGEVDRLQDHASEMQTRAIQGDDVAVHDVMIASEEASLAMSLMMEVRNKLMEAYQELMRMQA